MKKKYFFIIFIFILAFFLFGWFLLGDSFVLYLPKLGGYFCVFLLFVFLVSGVFSSTKGLKETKEN
ncbi:MAG: hypothetical protein WCY43_00080 [Patescibacteria group bacterium]|nr:hypothetical protein [Patescibacteria group bacterium]